MVGGGVVDDLGEEIAEAPEAYNTKWRCWYPTKPTDEQRKEVTISLETMQIHVAVAWADIILGYTGFILKYVVIPAVIVGMIGKLSRHG